MSEEKLELETARPDNVGQSETEHTASPSESVLRFFQSWAHLYEGSDYWPEICRQWADTSFDNATGKWAKPLLEKLFLYTNEREREAAAKAYRHKLLEKHDLDGSVFFDDKGSVIKVGTVAADILRLDVSDDVQDVLVDRLSLFLGKIGPDYASEKQLVEVEDRSGIRRLAYLSRDGSAPDKYRLTLHAIRLHPDAETYMRRAISLTEAELDVLARSLRRQSLDEIAEKRQSKVSTIRTHINNIIRKFGCRNFTDALTRTYEINHHHENRQNPFTNTDVANLESHVSYRVAALLHLTARNAQVEFSQYGASRGRPLILLHSLEYGFAPSEQFVAEAKVRGFTVYAPLRPGFGRSSVSDSEEDCAEILSEFISLLRLENVTVVALSMAAPTALHLHQASRQVRQTVIVNYAFNAANKLSTLKPTWLKGLLDLTVTSDASFKFAIRMTKKMYRTLGFDAFYEKLYSGCPEDLEYLSQNPVDFKVAAEVWSAADEKSLQRDLISSFRPNSGIETLMERSAGITAVLGANTHRAPIQPVADEATKYGIPFHIAPDSGRNCIFHRPATLFDVIAETSPPLFQAIAE